MALNEAGMYLQKVYTNMTQNFELQMIDAYHHLSPCNIDNLVDLEMKRLRNNYQVEEERYVEEMLKANPIIVERRNVPKRNEVTEVPATKERLDALQQQRAESCRNSRINNKIKKAKTKFRHKYVTNKLTQSVNMLDCIRDVIAQAEQQLLCSGYNQATLQKLRNTFGMDRSKENLNSNMIMQLE